MRTPTSTVSRLLAVIALSGFASSLTISASAEHHESEPLLQFNDAGELLRIDDWREWVHIGSPVTPNGLNGGKAALPEVHTYYMDPASWENYKQTGKFRDGTVMAGELSLLLTEGAEADGSTRQVSGRGYFQGEFAGLLFSIKDSTRFADQPGYWAYFTFGFGPASEYAESASVLPVEACNSCHAANAAEDWVFTQFYPVMRAAKPN